MAAVSSYQIGRRICDAFGLDATGVTRIEVTVPTNDIVTVTVTRQMLNAEGDAFVSVLERYELTAKT